MATLDDWLRPAIGFIDRYLLTDTVRIELPPTGEPVLNPETGDLERPDPYVLYEGPGAVIPGVASDQAAVTDAGQPWVQQDRSRYTLLTPLAAPVPRDGATVSVVAVHDPARTALLGRTWLCVDAGQASTVEVVRKTPLDQNHAPTAEAA